jgi:hypothetical protein
MVDPLDPSQGTIGNPYALVTEGGGGIFQGDVTNWSSTDTAPNPEVLGTPRLTDFVLSGGDICVAYGDYAGLGDGGLDPVTNPNALRPIPVACGTLPADLDPALIVAGYNAVSVPIVHNLGNDSFPYAIKFPELNDLIAGLNTNPLLADYTLHVDIRLGCGNNPVYTSGAVGDNCLPDTVTWGNQLTNGPESAVIGATGARLPPRIPEPGILLLLGLGLAALGFARRRNKV